MLAITLSLNLALLQEQSLRLAIQPLKQYPASLGMSICEQDTGIQLLLARLLMLLQHQPLQPWLLTRLIEDLHCQLLLGNSQALLLPYLFRDSKSLAVSRLATALRADPSQPFDIHD